MEEKDNVYQNAQSAQTADADLKEGATDLGKFKDVSALMKAYNALQAEFTRRSQRLRALENAVDNSTAERNDADETNEAGGLIAPAQADEPTVAMTPSLEAEEIALVEQGNTGEHVPVSKEEPIVSKQQNQESLYEAVAKDDAVRNRIIGEYLASLQGGTAPLMRGGTGEPAVSRKRATDFSEAGKMALQFFKNDNK